MDNQHVIKNYDSLAITDDRKLALDLVETALSSIQFESVLKHSISLQDNTLTIMDKTFDLSTFSRVFVLGFGKGSLAVCSSLEKTLGDKLTEGFDIDVVDQQELRKIKYTKGTHPLPSQTNIDFTKQALAQLNNLTEKDLVLVVICGGGSAMFEDPYTVDLETLTKAANALLKSGADITQMNVIRKHLSRVKGGGLAKLLYPATITSLIFSDVPGNDLSVIASGPTVKNTSSMNDVKQILEKFTISEQVQLSDDDFTETPTEEKYFAHVSNILIVSNQTALSAMQKKAEEKGYNVRIYSDKVQGDARTLGQKLLNEAKSGEILLAGGESTIHVTGSGKGGRNQALILSSLPFVTNDSLLIAFDSDGWDFYGLAGALADSQTLHKIKEQGVDPQQYLAQDDSFGFFEKIGDGIDTGKLESNVSDLYIVIKK